MIPSDPPASFSSVLLRSELVSVEFLTLTGVLHLRMFLLLANVESFPHHEYSFPIGALSPSYFLVPEMGFSDPLLESAIISFPKEFATFTWLD